MNPARRESVDVSIFLVHRKIDLYFLSNWMRQFRQFSFGNRNENRHHDHIPLNLKGKLNLFFWVYKKNVIFSDSWKLECRLGRCQTEIFTKFKQKKKSFEKLLPLGIICRTNNIPPETPWTSRQYGLTERLKGCTQLGLHYAERQPLYIFAGLVGWHHHTETFCPKTQPVRTGVCTPGQLTHWYRYFEKDCSIFFWGTPAREM